MVQTIAALGALLLSAGILIAGNGLFQTLVSVHLTTVGVPVDQASIVLSGYYAGLVLGSVRGPKVIGRVGHIRSFAAFAALLTIAALLHPIVPAGFGWFALRLLAGFAMAGLLVTIESWLNDRAAPENRGMLLSVYMIVNFSSLAGGQLLVGVAPPTEFLPFAIAAILFCLAVVPISAIAVQSPAITPTRRLGPAALFRVSPLGLVGACAIGFMNGAFYSLGPIFAAQTGMDLVHVSWFMTSAVVGGFSLQWPIGWLSDHFDRRKVLAAVAALAASTAVALALLSGGNRTLLYVCAVLYGGFISTMYPLCVAHAQDFAAADQRVGTSGGLLLAFGLGASLGPMVAAQVMGLLGPSGLFAYTATVAGGLALYTLYRMRQRASPAQDQRMPFVGVAPTHTPVAMELDPRGTPQGPATVTLAGEPDGR